MNYSKAYDLCRKKLEIHMRNLDGILYEFQESFNGKYEEKGLPLSNYWNWLSSCTTGMAALAFQTHGDLKSLKWANSFKKQYADKVSEYPAQAMHDLGFLYIPYSEHLYKLTGDPEHRETALKAADALSKRFNLNGRFIEAWDEMTTPEREGRMIIDSMMNIPLLFWAWQETGYVHYYEMAVAHAETIIKMLVREDYSVCHACLVDVNTGEFVCEKNSCGFADGSHWARGTAWMVYGLETAYKYTKNEKYLTLAEKIGEKFVDCLTEDDFIPVWDFRLPENQPARACRQENAEPKWDETLAENKKYNRDTSAAAIICCAFSEIYDMTGNEKLKTAKDNMLKSLTEKYLNKDENIPGMLSCSNGRNGYTIYGDYFYMRALAIEEYGITK